MAPRYIPAERKAQLLEICLKALASKAIHFEQVKPGDEALRRLEALRKGDALLPLSLLDNDFLETNALWVFFKNANGADIGVAAARFDDLGETKLTEFWRSLRRRALMEDNRSGAGAPVPVSGKCIYLGDVYFHRDYRAQSNNLRAVVFAIYCLASIEWKEFQYIYAVISDHFANSGSSATYCASGQIMLPGFWGADDDGPHWLLHMDREAFSHYVDLFIGDSRLLTRSKDARAVQNS